MSSKRRFPKKTARGPSKAIKKYIAQALRKDKERKYVAYDADAVAISTTGTTIDLSDIATGDGVNTREGHEIFATSIQGRYVVLAGDANNIVRFILYSKKDTSAADLAVDTNDFIDPDQFTIYFDKIVTTGTGNLQKMVAVNHKFRGKGKKITYDGTASTSYTMGHTQLYIVSDSSATAHPARSGHVAINFTE